MTLEEFITEHEKGHIENLKVYMEAKKAQAMIEIAQELNIISNSLAELAQNATISKNR